jgi:hypothetical protein
MGFVILFKMTYIFQIQDNIFFIKSMLGREAFVSEHNVSTMGTINICICLRA